MERRSTEVIDSILGSCLVSLPADRSRLMSRYRLVDIARKVVRVGSVGTSCWVILIEGLDAGDPLLLQVKKARPSVLATYAPHRILIRNEGRRVVVRQRMIQGSPDVFLGYGSIEGKQLSGSFYLRQLADMKGGFRFNEGQRDWADKLPELASLCGWAAALVHAKSGDAAMISGCCGQSDALADSIASFAMAYADQTIADHAALLVDGLQV